MFFMVIFYKQFWWSKNKWSINKKKARKNAIARIKKKMQQNTKNKNALYEVQFIIHFKITSGHKKLC